MQFDFDEWKRLFETDPGEAERRRKEVIEAAIARTTPRQQENLRRLQWRIDMVRVCYKASSISGCIALNQMLFDRVLGAGGLTYFLSELSKLLQQSIRVNNTDTGGP